MITLLGVKVEVRDAFSGLRTKRDALRSEPNSATLKDKDVTILKGVVSVGIWLINLGRITLSLATSIDEGSTVFEALLCSTVHDFANELDVGCLDTSCSCGQQGKDGRGVLHIECWVACRCCTGMIWARPISWGFITLIYSQIALGTTVDMYI